MTLLAQPGTVEALLEVAASQEGYVEQGGPDGRSGNITKYWADTYPPFQGASWCADFVSWCFIMAGCPLPPIDHQFGFTYCPDLANMANQKGWVISGPRPGAVVLYREAGTWAHTEICRSVADANGNFWTTGGNTSSGNAGSQSNGGGVYRRLRNVAGIGGGGCMFVWVPVFKSAAAPAPAPVIPFYRKKEFLVETVRIEAPDAQSPKDEKGRAYRRGTVTTIPGTKGLVQVATDPRNIAAPTVRVAVGSGRPDSTGKPGVWSHIEELPIANFPANFAYDHSKAFDGDEQASVENYGPGDVTLVAIPS